MVRRGALERCETGATPLETRGKRKPVTPENDPRETGLSFLNGGSMADRNRFASGLFVFGRISRLAGDRVAETRKALARCARALFSWCLDTELNCGHGDFQSPALPTELSRQEGSSMYKKLFCLARSFSLFDEGFRLCKVVPRHRVELRTRGFSVPCSTY